MIRHAITIQGNGATIQRDKNAPDFGILALEDVGPDGRFANLTIKNGGAWRGGGMHIRNSSPTISDCAFIENLAFSGGGIYNDNSSPLITNCVFERNQSDDAGGGMANYTSSPTIKNSVFRGNSALGQAGGIQNGGGAPAVIECIFLENKADWGGGMVNQHSQATVAGCTFKDK